MGVISVLLLASLAPAMLLLWRGPTPWDRLLAYNSSSNRIVVALCLFAVMTRETLLLDVTIGYAALSFLGVVIIARNLERGGGAQ
ncbi:MAG TPA: cation:proton antiporter [Candidatus Acetothermia bacterium]|nr:cation:proton antiporter [Candidatus Acetothermia bacterium]